MFRRKIVASSLVLALLAGCSHRSSPVALTSAPASTLPQDDLGREIKLSSAPRRIISLAPGVTETIFALGMGDRLVGRDQSSDFPAQAKNIAIAGDFNGPFAEKAIALRPDLIIAQGETYDQARVELWQRKCGVPVVLLNANSVAGVATGIEKIAAWLGVPEKGKPLAKRLNEAGRVKPGASFVSWGAFFEVGRSPLWSAGNDTLIGDVLRHEGLYNVAKINGYKPFSLESLAKADPIFYIVTAQKPDLARTLRELRAVPALRGLKCIRKGRVIVVPADWVLRPGPRLIKGLADITRQSGVFITRDMTEMGELKP